LQDALQIKLIPNCPYELILSYEIIYMYTISHLQLDILYNELSTIFLIFYIFSSNFYWIWYV